MRMVKLTDLTKGVGLEELPLVLVTYKDLTDYDEVELEDIEEKKCGIFKKPAFLYGKNKENELILINSQLQGNLNILVDLSTIPMGCVKKIEPLIIKPTKKKPIDSNQIFSKEIDKGKYMKKRS